MSACAVIVAAGSGSRLGGESKQFRLIGDQPVLAWSCSVLAFHPGIERLVVVLPQELAESPPAWLDQYQAIIVTGGSTRRESVGCGLAAVGDSDVVLIHDAARPFISPDLVTRLLHAVTEHGAVIPVLELSDAIKRVDTAGPGASVAQTLDRSVLRAAQTPQAFAVEQILELHEMANLSGEKYPDDAAMCEAAGITVRTIPGERWAFKITHAEELALAQWLVESGRIRGPKDS